MVNGNFMVISGEVRTKPGYVRWPPRCVRGKDHPPSYLPNKDQCKHDGWINFGFGNQGQCIQFVNTGKRDHEEHGRGH